MLLRENLSLWNFYCIKNEKRENGGREKRRTRGKSVEGMFEKVYKIKIHQIIANEENW